MPPRVWTKIVLANLFCYTHLTTLSPQSARHGERNQTGHFNLSTPRHLALPNAVVRQLSQLSANIFAPSTLLHYNSMQNKWTNFCYPYGINSEHPQQSEINAYIAYLASVGNCRNGGHVASDTIKTYVMHVARFIDVCAERRGIPITNVCRSVETGWAMQAAKRVLGASKQRARPITLGEIRNVIATTAHWGALGTLVRLVALIAFWGGFRLGALLPHQGSQVNGDAMRLSDLDLLTNAVVVRSTKDKTNQFRERMHSLTLPMSRHDTQTCIKDALERMLALLPRETNRQTRLADLCGTGTLTFELFVQIVQQAIPATAASTMCKGHITGHSFRRGFTHAALAAGFSITDIMIHGDWKRPESVLAAYAVGMSVPCIQLTWHLQ